MSTDVSEFERFEVRERESERGGKRSEGGLKKTQGEIFIQMNQRNCCRGKIVGGGSVAGDVPKIAKRRREGRWEGGMENE